MPINSRKLREFYNVLHSKYGHQNWWPADSRLECIIGAILTQNTSWDNASRAVSNLKSAMELTVNNLYTIPLPELSGLIRPAGYFNLKANRIKNFISFLINNFSGDLDKLFENDTYILRNKLLEVSGIGPETADSILLYAGEKPVFVVDNYTHRILSRHMLIPEDAGYQEIQDFFMDSLEHDADIYNEYHALIVLLAKKHCRKSPVCENCPLEYDLIEKGIR